MDKEELFNYLKVSIGYEAAPVTCFGCHRSKVLDITDQAGHTDEHIYCTLFEQSLGLMEVTKRGTCSKATRFSEAESKDVGV